MGPQTGIVGDMPGMELPETRMPEEELVDEKNLAKFSKTKEYKRLKEYMEIKINFYQTFLPNGKEVGIDAQPTAEDWRVANRVIAEFKAVLQSYENANEAVEDAARRSTKL